MSHFGQLVTILSIAVAATLVALGAQGDPRSSVAGRVHIDGDPPGEPVRLALLQGPGPDLSRGTRAVFEDPRSRIMGSDPSGSFRFTGLSPDWSGALYVPRGYRVERSNAETSTDRTSIRLAEPREDLVLDLVRLPHLVGRVLGSPGRSPNARAEVWRITFRHELETRGRRPLDGTVGRDGRFKIVLEEPELAMLRRGGSLTLQIHDAGLHEGRRIDFEAAGITRDARQDYDVGNVFLFNPTAPGNF
ncbi:MAG: hypothetical protein V3T14_10645 [Myxococcota bacterium]